MNVELTRGCLVTPEKLKALGACASGVRKFAKAYPKGLRLTRKGLIQAFANGHDVGWLAESLELRCACRLPEGWALDHDVAYLAALLAHFDL
jgi:hypothetical protein